MHAVDKQLDISLEAVLILVFASGDIALDLVKGL
jgi:hypothetical protein